MVTIPLELYSEDTSGNRSKKWNCFNLWCLLLAGLSKAQNAKLKNIHFLTCSNIASPLEMAIPIVRDLLMLEEEGLIAYDAFNKQDVLMVAPIICSLADNPRASELLNHMGSAARKYCRICYVSIITMSCALEQLLLILLHLGRQGDQSSGAMQHKVQG